MSFYCDHCHFKNSEIQSAGEIQERGSKYTLKLDKMDDFERQVVKSDTAIFRVEDLDIEIPAGRGQLTNVEGILNMVLKDLEVDQPRRETDEPELFAKVDAIVQSLIKLMSGTRFPFKISINDAAGNAWIEPSPDDKDGRYVHTEYARSPEQNAALGLGDGGSQVEEAEQAAPTAAQDVLRSQPIGDPAIDTEIVNGEPLVFHTACPGCTKPCEVRMRMVDVPHFTEVVLISTACDHCGYRTSEVKTGGAVPEKGRQIILKVQEQVDLSRDVLKSETCTVFCPELKLEITPGTMSGRFTTVEGLLSQVHDTLYTRVFDAGAAGGDSRDPERKAAWENLFKNLQAAIKGEFKYQIVLTDPLAASYIQNLCTPDEDPQLTILDYERSGEEEEELGLTDMRTEVDSTGTYRSTVVDKVVQRAERLAEERDGVKNAEASGVSNERGVAADEPFEGEESGLYIKQASNAKSGVKATAGSENVKQPALASDAPRGHEHIGHSQAEDSPKAEASVTSEANTVPTDKEDYVVVDHAPIEDDWSEASTTIDRNTQ